MNAATKTIVINWIGLMVSSGVLGAGVMMLAKGTLPGPMSKIKVSPVVGTGVFVVGLTAALVYGTPDLLQSTIGLFVK